MDTDLSRMPILLRREIEAKIAGPLINAFIQEMGREKALEAAGRVIARLARQSGAELAQALGGNSFSHLSKGQGQWAAMGALQREVLRISPDEYHYNIVQCKYADMYRELGMADLGFVLSCGRDAAMFEGFNPRIRLTRTQTIMQGADYCDFRLTMLNA